MKRWLFAAMIPLVLLISCSVSDMNTFGTHFENLSSYEIRVLLNGGLTSFTLHPGDSHDEYFALVSNFSYSNAELVSATVAGNRVIFRNR
jgi:hypothetical protein